MDAPSVRSLPARPLAVRHDASHATAPSLGVQTIDTFGMKRTASTFSFENSFLLIKKQ